MLNCFFCLTSSKLASRVLYLAKPVSSTRLLFHESHPPVALLLVFFPTVMNSDLNSALHWLPSAVKHNATRLYHSHVWGYRWPAVCLCSSPLGQLEPSISYSPPFLLSPVVSVCPAGPPPQQQCQAVSWEKFYNRSPMRTVVVEATSETLNIFGGWC